jgi:uncharacterized protein (TIGR00269 family)
MKCKKCEQPAAITRPKSFCSKHFTEYFEKTVSDTIKKFSMIKPGERVCVAASGGKDSMTLLHVLKKLGYDVEALVVDEGIAGYRDDTLEHLKKYCTQNSIKLHSRSFEKSFGKRLDSMTLEHPCSTCGVWRRKLLNEGAVGFSKLAMGHNMDDEAQGILMNLNRAQLALLFRTGPVTQTQANLVVRIKPFYFLTEKEVATYAVIHSLNPSWKECPYSRSGYRDSVRDWLNKCELENPGTKRRIIEWFLKLKSKTKYEEGKIMICQKCGSPSSNETCRACGLAIFSKS